MKCPNGGCGADIVRSQRHCIACGADIGAPNVRAANDSAEVSALGVRYADELRKAQDVGYEADFLRFVELLAQSKAVVCMPSSRLLTLASDPASLLSTFGLQIEGESRVPLDNRFDNIRASVEEAFFPNYSREIRFAALSLTDSGHAAYGACSVTLKDSSISNRATVFEFPLFKFAEVKSVKLSEAIPAGHRADWLGRSKLAAVKFDRRVEGMGDDQMAEILLPTPTDTVSDCVEVHIYGSLNRYSIAGVVMTPEKRRADILIQKAVVENLTEIGVSVRYVA